MCDVQAHLLLWMYMAVHSFAQPPSARGQNWPESWRVAAGRLAAQGTPDVVLAGGIPGDPQVNAGDVV